MAAPRIRTNAREHDEHQREFLKRLQAVSRSEGWHDYDTMCRWLEQAFRALRGRVLAGDDWQKNEDAYLDQVRRLRDPNETMGEFAKMLGCATLSLMAKPADFLGPIFSEIAASSQLGQFFTPHEVCMLMARMNVADAKSILEQSGRGYITLQEPACGVGGMMLATNIVLAEQGIDLARQAHWVAIDIDFRAMAGAYIQLSLTGASAWVFHGDALRLTTHMATPTLAAVMHPKQLVSARRAEQSPEQEPQSIPPVPSTIPPTVNRRGQFAFDF